MSRTHFIPAQQTAIAQAIAPVQDQIITTDVEPLKTSTWFEFIETLSVAQQARRYTMWSAANSLNNFIIANIQSHLRQLKYAEKGADEINQSVDYLRRAGADQKTIDEFNEQQAAIQALKDSAENRMEQGFEAVVDPLDTAEKLIAIRSYFASVMAQTAKGPRDMPQPLEDSIAFRLAKLPAADEKKLMQIHVVTQIPLDVLRKADIDVKISERKNLLEQAGQIIDIGKQLSWKSSPDGAEAEGLFDKLPVQTQYRLIGNTLRALKAAMDAEVKALIRFGRMDSVTNRVLIADVLESYKAFFTTFTHDHADALVEYESRGYLLPTMDEFLADKVSA